MSGKAPIVLIGGTRGTGLQIAHLLLEKGYPVRVMARDPIDAAKRLGPKPEISRGDLADLESISAAIHGAGHIIFTAGWRSGRPAREPQIRRTEYDGVVNALEAARRVAFPGRFLYLTSSGVGHRSFWTTALNLYKGNTLQWRHRAESAIRRSGLAYTIIRTGVLLNAAGGRHGILVTQRPLPLSPRYRIARADVAQVFVAAMEHPRTARSTFEIAWKDDAPGSWQAALDGLEQD